MAHSGKPALSWYARLASAGPRFSHFWHKEIWLSSHLKESSPRGVLYACLRVISISSTVFVETKAASRAAALSFSSLLGLGPLVAITVLVAGFALDSKDPNLAANTLSRLINFIAPQVGQLGSIEEKRAAAGTTAEPASPAPKKESPARSETKKGSPAPAPAASAAPAPAPAAASESSFSAADILAAKDLKVNPKLVSLMNNFIAQGRSGSAGTVGLFGLILIVLLLFKTVEDTFNEIWGVRSGRSIVMRIVYYWTVLTLGAVLFFASVTLMSATAVISVFNDTISHLPFSKQVGLALQWSLPAFSFALLVVLLTVFYRVIPNTRVFWRAAVSGAVVVASLLMLNNFLAILYVRRVIMTESLYGSLGFPLVVMFGLYIFWLYVLIGGQISYAVQNVHFRNSQAAWSNLTEAMRERLSLLALLTICRRFQACQPPVSASELGTMIKVPTQILNECLNRLVDMKLITPIPPPPTAADRELLYQPARPLNRISLWEFKHLDDNLGDSPAGVALEGLDPLLNRYNSALAATAEQPLFKKNLEELFVEFAYEGPKAPGAAGGGSK
ncbi:MAG TPA: YihY/virulence factor BrkB family protein [Opitutaceae bacterium]|nr:YihY/virulence factor BrkB family protein [Opitutaceae bacterium]